MYDFKSWESYYLEGYQKNDLAFKLWIYYFTVTEKYDKNLQFTRPSRHDKDIVIPYGSSIVHSNRFANDKKRLIYFIAKSYGISEEEMFLEKNKMSRFNQRGIEREFNSIDFAFIDKYIEED